MKHKTKAYLSLLFICIVWGTTYLAIRVGVLHFPAFLFAAIRQIVAGSIIAGIAWLINKETDLSWANLRQQIWIGFLLITLGNGCVTWGERAIPSGVAALICSMMPMCAVIINLIISKRDRLNF